MPDHVLDTTLGIAGQLVLAVATFVVAAVVFHQLFGPLAATALTFLTVYLVSRLVRSS
jgi:hypothetical protein